jgi:hypothetical protein
VIATISITVAPIIISTFAADQPIILTPVATDFAPLISRQRPVRAVRALFLTDLSTALA